MLLHYMSRVRADARQNESRFPSDGICFWSWVLT